MSLNRSSNEKYKSACHSTLTLKKKTDSVLGQPKKEYNNIYTYKNYR